MFMHLTDDFLLGLNANGCVWCENMLISGSFVTS